MSAGSIVDHLAYVPLGVIAGLMGTLLPVAFYGARELFRKLPGPPHFKPALGGLAVGMIALAFPAILGGGYGWIQHAIDDRLGTWLLFALVFAKVVAFCCTVSSGGSGGVFAPSLFVGAMLGAFMARILHQPAAGFTVVGMAAVFGAAARVPIATLFMVTEMTGGYQLLVPAALAVAIAFLTQVLSSGHLQHRSMYEAQVPQRAHSPAHHAEHLRLALEQLQRRRVPLPEKMQHVQLVALLKSGIPVVLGDDRLLTLEMVTADSPRLALPALEHEMDGPRPVLLIRNGRVLIPADAKKVELGDELLLISPAAPRPSTSVESSRASLHIVH